MPFVLTFAPHDAALPRVKSAPVARQQIAPPIDAFSRLGLFIGAASLGASAGVTTAFAFGSAAPMTALAIGAAACLLAAGCALMDFLEAADDGRVVCAALDCMRLTALAAWPITLLFAPAQSALAFTAALATLFGSAALSQPNGSAVARAALPGAALAGVGAHLAICAVMN